MCGRISFVMDAEKEKYFRDFYFDPSIATSYNIAPSEFVPAVRNTGDNLVEPLTWGLVPSWSKDLRAGYKMINARSESLSQKPAFREAIKLRRCLILADGFYEWKHLKKGRSKIPYYIRCKNNNPMAFAGLWDEWKDPLTSGGLTTCTVVTTSANELVMDLHDRMPVLIRKEDFSRWLDTQAHEAKEYQDLFKPYPSDELVAYQVSTKVNKAGISSPELIKPVKTGLDAFL